MDKIIYRRLKEFAEDFDSTECPFGNSGTFFDPDRDELEAKRCKKIFDKYGQCEGLCVKLGFSTNGHCPCLEHGRDKSLRKLKRWLKLWEKTHPGETATTTSGKSRKSGTTTKTPKTTTKVTKGTPKKK